MPSPRPASVRPAPPAPQPPGPAWVQLVTPPPDGPVTLLSKVAGIIIVLFGLVLTAASVGVVWSYRDGFSWVAGTRSLVVLIGIGILLVGVPVLVAGIGILRGAVSGRIIGIVSSLLFGAGSLAWGLGQVAGEDADVISALILGLVFVLNAYSAIVLMFRWRRAVTA